MSIKGGLNMKVAQAVIKRLIETGVAIDVTNAKDFKRDLGSTIIFISSGASGVNGAALATWDGKIYAVVGRCSNLFLMIR
jgi:hypothetical protein